MCSNNVRQGAPLDTSDEFVGFTKGGLHKGIVTCRVEPKSK